MEVPSTSKDDTSSPSKKRRRVALSDTEKIMVHNIFNYILKEQTAKAVFEKPSKRMCAEKTAELLGICTATVFNVLKEFKESGTVAPPRKTGPKRTFVDKFDEFTFSAIRQKVHAFIDNEKIPTIAKITDAVNKDSKLPNLSKSTMRLVLKKLNFKYVHCEGRRCLIDTEDITHPEHKMKMATSKERKKSV